MLDSIYLQNKRNPVEIQKWQVFFTKIGVTDFVEVKQMRVEISAENIVSRLQMLLKSFQCVVVLVY